MTFKKGEPRPANAGRKKGSRNKNKLLVAEILEAAGIDLIEQILVRLPTLKPEDQVKALISLLPYRYPKLMNVEVSQDLKKEEERPLKDVTDHELDTILIEKD